MSEQINGDSKFLGCNDEKIIIKKMTIGEYLEQVDNLKHKEMFLTMLEENIEDVLCESMSENMKGHV